MTKKHDKLLSVDAVVTSAIMKGDECFMKKVNLMKVAGVVLPLASAGVALVTSWFEDKKLDDKISEKVAEALVNSTDKES